MEKCLHSPKSRIDRWGGLVGFLLIGALCVALAGLGFQEDPNATSSCILLFITGLVLWFWGIFLYVVQSREYSVDSSGITVSYCKFYKVKYLWINIRDISICDIDHAPKNADVFDVVIRIVDGKEKRGPFSNNQRLTLAGYERWRTLGYSIMHFDKIIILDYTQERHNKIQMLSGKTIHDFMTDYARTKRPVCVNPNEQGQGDGSAVSSQENEIDPN